MPARRLRGCWTTTTWRLRFMRCCFPTSSRASPADCLRPTTFGCFAHRRLRPAVDSPTRWPNPLGTIPDDGAACAQELRIRARSPSDQTPAMRRGLQLQVVERLAQGLPAGWNRRGATLWRRRDNWAQVLGVGAGGQGREEFAPFTSLELLPVEVVPGRIVGGCATTRLQSTRFPVDRWVSVREFQRDPEP